MKEAKDTLFMAEKYMDELGKEFENLRKKKLTDKQVMDYIEILLPVEDGSTPQQVRNMKRLQEDMKLRYFDAPDLQDVGNNAYRFINAVSDFATHAQPLRKTANYKENLFARALGLFLLMLAIVPMTAAFLKDPVTRLLIPIWWYPVLTVAMFWVGKPFLFRDWFHAAVKHPRFCRLVNVLGLVYGGTLLVCALLFW